MHYFHLYHLLFFLQNPKYDVILYAVFQLCTQLWLAIVYKFFNSFFFFNSVPKPNLCEETLCKLLYHLSPVNKKWRPSWFLYKAWHLYRNRKSRYEAHHICNHCSRSSYMWERAVLQKLGAGHPCEWFHLYSWLNGTWGAEKKCNRVYRYSKTDNWHFSTISLISTKYSQAW